MLNDQMGLRSLMPPEGADSIWTALCVANGLALMGAWMLLLARAGALSTATSCIEKSAITETTPAL
jgi:hypothetical protein